MHGLPHVHSPSLAPGIEPLREARFATQDGAIWPAPRHRMLSPATIRARMAEDIAEMIRDRGIDGTVDTEDLTRLGWTPAQAREHGLAAAVRARRL